MVVRGGVAQLHEFVDDQTLHDIMVLVSRAEARRAFWQEQRREGLARIRAMRVTRAQRGGR